MCVGGWGKGNRKFSSRPGGMESHSSQHFGDMFCGAWCPPKDPQKFQYSVTISVMNLFTHRANRLPLSSSYESSTVLGERGTGMSSSYDDSLLVVYHLHRLLEEGNQKGPKQKTGPMMPNGCIYSVSKGLSVRPWCFSDFVQTVPQPWSVRRPSMSRTY